MNLLSALPAALVTLVLASPVLSASSSPNDPFRAISAHVPEPPVCCLIPLPATEQLEDEILLSFEEWKEKQALAKSSDKDKDPLSSSTPNLAQQNAGRDSTSSPGVDNMSSNSDILDLVSESDSLSPEKVSPHFQIPLTDRFNYASTDCSARVHLAHRSAKSPASILSSKRDRYMLSPCNSGKEDQFVVVELCEDIRIDTVQLANFEFFSGVFKDFTVSVAKTYKEDFVSAGTYKAKNVRGVQSFHPPKSLTGFYRFIRIDFHTHYSNEYYCPISLLRVYGLTHLEEWKWEIWEAESKAKREEIPEPSLPLEVTAEEPLPIQPLVFDLPVEKIEASADNRPASTPLFDDIIQKDELTSSLALTPSTTAPLAWEQHATTITAEGQAAPGSPDTHANIDDDTTTSVAPTSSVILLPISPNTSTSIGASEITAVSSSQSSPTITSASPSSSLSSVSMTHQAHTPPPATGGESIYRIIMNRLTALEANHTLYVRYVEEQTNGIREMIRRLSEDVGRLEGIGKAQTQRFQRSVKEWDNQRAKLETEYNELTTRIAYLSDEIVLEKRLSIAQLCLLLAVIIFMGLTRGSRGDSSVQHRHLRFNRSMREWSRRHLNFSGDWVNRFTTASSRSRSQSPSGTVKSPKMSSRVHHEDEPVITFPTLSARPRVPKTAPHTKSHAFLAERKPKVQNVYLQSRPRSRTPSLRTPHNLPTTPTTAVTTTYRPQILRANSLTSGSAGLPASVSWTGVGPVPKSAKRWARTAHLHEVKSPAPSAAIGNRVAMNVVGEGEEKKNQRTVARVDSMTTLKLAAFTPKDKAKSLDDNIDGNVFPDAPDLPNPVLNGVDPGDTEQLNKLWRSSPSSSCDGDDADLWVDTDNTDTATEPSVDGDFGFGFDDR
ncbi:UNC-like C-terminal-domain-containing protein [Rhodocollybia butyracea]|uniref:UNC-like C-terminal-domain-containing protein n=1 Tax=Rhodocollybia butyracea TaxID=206335 RepID=A0A9P5U729_9AGAR|nr:UNC-like C-terminal-domain-containing protein [Rhodocollybia butyracea]